MVTLDYNLLPALHALIEEASVSRAARRLGVTVPAMSRTLARLRETLGDPLLVRAGREMVRTPFADAQRDRVARASDEIRQVLTRKGEGSVAETSRTLFVRTNDGLLGPLLHRLLDELRAHAPGLSLAFVAEGEESPAELRDGRVHLDIGVLGESAPELRSQVLLRDRFVCVVRKKHPLTRGPVTEARLVAYEHLSISHRGRLKGPIDALLAKNKLQRRVVAAVPSSTTALMAVATSDLVTAAPRSVARALASTLPITLIDPPWPLPPLAIAQTWHPRFDEDPAHRWLRECLARLTRSAARGD